MTRKTPDQDKASKAQTPGCDDKGGQIVVDNPFTRQYWVKMLEIFTKKFWVDLFTSDDGFMKGLKWGYIMIGVYIAIFVALVVIPKIWGG